MSEMLSRVANAIRAEIGRQHVPRDAFDWGAISRSGIGAMREPTEEMLSAGAIFMPDYDPGNDDMLRCWQAAIDAALKE